jgi:hypothetical protein
VRQAVADAPAAPTRGLTPRRVAVRRQSRFGDAVLGAFLATQVLDGYLTYRGIRDLGLGVEVEANPLVAIAIGALGVRVALFLFKAVASLAGVFLHTRRYHRVLATLTALYVVAAIGPWLVLLYTNLIVER